MAWNKCHLTIVKIETSVTNDRKTVGSRVCLPPSFSHVTISQRSASRGKRKGKPRRYHHRWIKRSTRVPVTLDGKCGIVFRVVSSIYSRDEVGAFRLDTLRRGHESHRFLGHCNNWPKIRSITIDTWNRRESDLTRVKRKTLNLNRGKLLREL